MSKHSVISSFWDKDTIEHHVVGDVYESKDSERIAFLVDRGFLASESLPSLDQDQESEEIDVDQYHTGGGYYELPDGNKVRGKGKALNALKELEGK